MPHISFRKKNRASFQVDVGANLMQSLLRAQVPVASSCKGDGVCAKCRVQITEGLQHLSPANETEIFLREKFQLRSDQRVSCQTQVLGDVELDTGYW